MASPRSASYLHKILTANHMGSWGCYCWCHWKMLTLCEKVSRFSARSGAPCILNCQITATTRILRCITQISLLNLAFTFALSYTGEVTMFMVTPFTVSISICGDVELLSIGGIAPLPPTFAHTTRFAEYRMCAPLPSWHKLFMVNLIDPFLHRQIFTVPPPWAATIYNIVL